MEIKSSSLASRCSTIFTNKLCLSAYRCWVSSTQCSCQNIDEMASAIPTLWEWSLQTLIYIINWWHVTCVSNNMHRKQWAEISQNKSVGCAAVWSILLSNIDYRCFLLHFEHTKLGKMWRSRNIFFKSPLMNNFIFTEIILKWYK